MRYFGSDTEKPITYSACGQLVSKDGFVHHRRCFEYDVLILVTEGTLYITTGGNSYEVSPDHYVFLRAGEEHYGYKPTKGKLSYLWMHVKPEAAFFLEKEYEEGHSYLFPENGRIAASKRVTVLFRQLLDMAMEEQLYNKNMLDYGASLVLMELTQETMEQSIRKENRIPPVIFSVAEWIRTNYYKQISVLWLANEFGYQADYLSVLFKKHMGSTLVQYVNKVRMENAKRLLADYGLPIKETAYVCGFPDEKYFMKVFKKTEGLTPTQYKNAYYKKLINS